MSRVALLFLLFPGHAFAQESVWKSYLDSGRQALDRGEYETAARLLALAEKEADAFPAGDTRRTQAWHSLALLAERQYRYADAEGYYKKGIALVERTKDPKFLAHVLTISANHYRLRGDFDLAEPLYKKALTLREKANGANAWETAQLLRDLADNHRDADRPDAAEALYKQALKILEGHKDRHYHVAFCLASLAELHVRQNRPAEAEALARQALATYDKEKTPVLFNRGLALGTLAEAQRQQKRFAEANEIFTQALTLLDESKGVGPRTLPILMNAARARAEAGQLDESKRLEEKALKIEAQHKAGKPQ